MSTFKPATLCISALGLQNRMVMTAETVSRLYETTTRRIMTDAGRILFVPEIGEEPE